jgi:cell wall-associated NlpC family hydrolase
MKAFVTIILIFSSFSLSAQVDSSKIDNQLTLTKTPENQDISQVMDSVLDFGKTLIGRRYRYGGLSPAGFDCSGFMKYIFRKYGITLPHCSQEYSHVGEVISKDSIETIRKGDFLIFKGRNSKSKRIGHVAIVVEVNEKEIKMIHSCCDKGVAIENYLISTYYVKRLIEIRRLKETI